MLDLTNVLIGPKTIIPNRDRFSVETFRTDGKPLELEYGLVDEIAAQNNLNLAKKMFELLQQEFIIPPLNLYLFDVGAKLEMTWKLKDGRIVGFDIDVGKDFDHSENDGHGHIRMSYFLKHRGDNPFTETVKERYRKNYSLEKSLETMTIEDLKPICDLLKELYEDEME